MEKQIEELLLDLEEIEAIHESAQRETVRSRISLCKSQIEAEIQQLREKQKKAENKISPQKPKIFTKKITTYAWDQTDKFIKIYVSNLAGVQDIPRENVTLTKEGDHYVLLVSELRGSNHQLVLPKLLQDVSETNCKVKTDEVVVLLKKASAGKWETLSAKEKKEKDEKYKTPKFDKDADPSKGIMDMMKKMYDDGDDDMKRTIAKAWTESREKQMGEM